MREKEDKREIQRGEGFGEGGLGGAGEGGGLLRMGHK